MKVKKSKYISLLVSFKTWIDINRPLLGVYDIILFVSIFISFIYLEFSGTSVAISFPLKIFSALSDSLLLFIPCLLLKGNWKILTIFVPLILNIIIISNILYFRNFGDFIPPTQYFHSQLDNTFILKGALSSLEITDIIFLINSLLPIISFFCLAQWKSEEGRNVLMIKVCSFLFLCSLVITYLGSYRRISIYENTDDFKRITTTLFGEGNGLWIFYYRNLNFSGYVIKTLFHLGAVDKTYTEEELLWAKENLQNNHNASPKISTPRGNIPQNLIFILVESLPYRVLELKDKTSLIPVLDSITKPGNSWFSKCMVLANYGRSSDAQFMINTGILPLQKEALITNYANKDYPSLAKALPLYSLEIIGESKTVWYHANTSKSYGFDRLIADVAPSGLDQDSIIFSRAITEIKNMSQPFFLFLTTIGMHDPYLEKKTSKEIALPAELKIDQRDFEYFQRLSGLDRALGSFIQQLKENGVYEKSLIIITGDHEIREKDISSLLMDDAVPFIILNSPIANNSHTITQADIFPTILDLMGRSYVYKGINYRGLGRSILNENETYFPTEQDYKISEILIRGPLTYY